MKLATTPNEGEQMDNGSLNATEIAVGSLLSGGNRGGVGGGAWGGGTIGAPFAGPASNAVRINRNEGTLRDQGEFTRAQMKSSLDRVSDQNEETRRNMGESRIMDSITSGHTLLNKSISDAEFRTGDRMRDLEREINQNARTAADCCCDIKVQAANDKAEVLSAVATQGAATITRELNNANAELTALKTQLACGCCPTRA